VGGLRIAKSDLTFAPVTVDVDGLGQVDVQTVAVSDLRGVINPTTGVVTLTVALRSGGRRTRSCRTPGRSVRGESEHGVGGAMRTTPSRAPQPALTRHSNCAIASGSPDAPASRAR
jgi:hypothetical protein